MSVVQLERLHSHASGRADLSSDEVRQQWLAVSNSLDDGPIAVRIGAQAFATNPVPAARTAYNFGGAEVGTSLRLEELSVDPDTPFCEYADGQSLYRWLITGVYKTRPLDTPAAADVSNPLLRGVRYWFEFSSYTRAAIKDVVTGEPIANSAKQPFDPPYEVEDGNTILVAEKNFAITSLATLITQATTYRYALNSATFYGAAAGYVRALPIVISPPQSENGTDFYGVQYRFEFSDQPWNLRPLDQGMKYIDDNGDLQQAQQDDGEFAYSEPVNLNGIDGQKLDPDEDGVFLDGAGGRLGPYNIYKSADFSLLGV